LTGSYSVEQRAQLAAAGAEIQRRFEEDDRRYTQGDHGENSSQGDTAAWFSAYRMRMAIRRPPLRPTTRVEPVLPQVRNLLA
jgi:hypothetical protein